MLLITSVPPHFTRACPQTGREVGLKYLETCIKSWRRNGFEPISLNRPEEVKAVSAFGLIECKGVQDDEALFPNKFGPSLGAILDYAPASTPVAIVNADVYMLSGVGIADRLSDICTNSVVAGRRIDVDQLGARDGKVFTLGYDLVAFQADAIPQSASNSTLRSFQLGLPWWDYAFPYSCSTEVPAFRLKEPFLAHHFHTDRWDSSIWTDVSLKAFQACPSIENPELLKNLKTSRAGEFIARQFIDGIFGERFAELPLPLKKTDPFFSRHPRLESLPSAADVAKDSPLDRILQAMAKPTVYKRDPIIRKVKRAIKSITT